MLNKPILVLARNHVEYRNFLNELAHLCTGNVFDPKLFKYADNLDSIRGIKDNLIILVDNYEMNKNADEILQTCVYQQIVPVKEKIFINAWNNFFNTTAGNLPPNE